MGWVVVGWGVVKWVVEVCGVVWGGGGRCVCGVVGWREGEEAGEREEL